MNMSFLIKKLFFVGVCSLTLLISANIFADETTPSNLDPSCYGWTGYPAGMIPNHSYELVKDSNGNWVKHWLYTLRDYEFQVRAFFEDPATKQKVVMVLFYDRKYNKCDVSPYWADELIWYN